MRYTTQIEDGNLFVYRGLATKYNEPIAQICLSGKSPLLFKHKIKQIVEADRKKKAEENMARSLLIKEQKELEAFINE